MENERNENQKRSEQTEPGEPGRTPGQAEGDRETVEQDLREKQGEKDDDRVRESRESV
jgi:hypothetical protein